MFAIQLMIILFFVQNLYQKNYSRCETLAGLFLLLMSSFMGFLFKDLFKVIETLNISDSLYEVGAWRYDGVGW